MRARTLQWYLDRSMPATLRRPTEEMDLRLADAVVCATRPGGRCFVSAAS